MIGLLPPLAEAVWSMAVGRIVGRIDGERHDRFCGWAFDRREPRRRLVVFIRTEPGVGVFELADRYRADVHQSGLGDGYCGFSVPLQRLGDIRNVRVFCSSPRIELRGRKPPGRLRRTRARPVLFQRDTYTLQLDEMPWD